MNRSHEALERSFLSCSFSTADDKAKSKDNIISFFVDSSGRSSFTVPLQMSFPTKKDLDELLASSCFDPPPDNLLSEVKLTRDDSCSDNGDRDETDVVKEKIAQPLSTTAQSTVPNASIAFEAKSFLVEGDDTNQVTVEGVSILGCSVKNLVVTLKTKVTVRAITRVSPSAATSTDSPAKMSPSRFSSSPISTSAEPKLKLKHQQQLQQINLSACFNITPVLIIENSFMNHDGDKRRKKEFIKNDFSPDLTLLKLAAIPDPMQYNKTNKAASGILSTSNDRVKETRLAPVTINVTLTNAFTITVQSLEGPKSRMGNTLVSLSIHHSKTHNLPVTITNIAVHPGHSQHNVIMDQSTADNNEKMRKQKSSGSTKNNQSVSNMTESVEWGYAPKTELKLPLVLLPHEAYSSIIYINAGEEHDSRQFLSPLSVTGVIEMKSNAQGDDAKNKADDNSNGGREQCRVVVASDAYWTTKPIAIEPADAFRIDMCIVDQTVKRGEPMVIKLRIFNLSLESRNLMIFMAKENIPSSPNKYISAKEKSMNAAVVAESDGYTFGVWGISGNDDGTVRLNRDHELLAIDTALVLGEVQGQHAVDAELRFVPLRLGRLKVPDWKLYDKTANRWYSCTHDLNIVSA